MHFKKRVKQVSNKTEEYFGSLAVMKTRRMREYVWETRAHEERTKAVKEVMDELTVDAEVAKLGAMILKGYVAKSKGSYLKCANCYHRIFKVKVRM